MRMEITYIVGNYEVSAGALHTIKEHVFQTVEEAIEFRDKQKAGSFSWWEIIVDYTKDT